MERADFPRVYPILDTASLARLGIDPVEAAAAMLKGGARIIQFRHKAFWSRGIFAQAEQIAALCHEVSATFIVNDRADYAQLLRAGLHLGQDDLLPKDARIVTGSSAIIGFSTHNAQQMREAASEPVDYVAFGPLFRSVSKERPDPIVGLETLREIRTLTDRPLVAIGGITLESAAACWNAGADSVAVIASLLPTPCTAASIRETMHEWITLDMTARGLNPSPLVS
jgi:thiamine-phosphate pyrophosphorylase